MTQEEIERDRRRGRLLLRVWTFTLGLIVSLILGATWLVVYPVELTSIVQPIPIDSDVMVDCEWPDPDPEVETKVAGVCPEVSVGDPILHTLEVSKPPGLNTVGSERFITCESGNLVTLVSVQRELPPGDFVVTVEDLLLPNKILDQDVCQLTYQVEYQINPLRNATASYTSQWFVVDASTEAQAALPHRATGG